MKLGNRILSVCALAGAFTLFSATTAWCQQAPPDLFRVSYYQVRADGAYSFHEGIKLINEAYRKSGAAWRRGWTASLFGETYTFVMSTPVKNFAEFDNPGPMTTMSAADNVKFQTLMRNAVASSRHVLFRFVPELSIYSGPFEAKTLARMLTVRVKPGKAEEFEDALKTMLLPAVKKSGFKDFRVNRGILGGASGEYLIVTPFAKWAELDTWPTNEKMLGPSYKAFMARIAETVDSSETAVFRETPELGYQPQ